MTQPSLTGVSHAPEWFGSAARGIAFFPVKMGAWATFYAAGRPFAWRNVGAVGFPLVLIAAVLFMERAVAQIRNTASFPNNPNAEDQRLGNAMRLLNTRPI